jgi:hypothetical protein
MNKSVCCLQKGGRHVLSLWHHFFQLRERVAHNVWRNQAVVFAARNDAAETATKIMNFFAAEASNQVAAKLMERPQL